MDGRKEVRIHYFILLHFTILMISDKKYNLCSSLKCSCLHLRIISFLLGPNILISILSSRILNLFSYLLWETRLHTHKKLYTSVCFNSYIFGNHRRQDILNWKVSSNPQIRYALNSFMNALAMCKHHSQISELCHIYKGSIINIDVTICITSPYWHLSQFLFIYLWCLC